MNIVAYVDESGTHDKTSGSVVVAGLVAWLDEWTAFNAEWQAVLTKYQASYFHFKEFSQASRLERGDIKPFKDFEKNPYKGWPRATLDAFLWELGEVAGSGNKVIVGAYVDTSDFHKKKIAPNRNPKTIPCGGDPFKFCLQGFFERLPKDILSVWPYWTEPVSIFFDRVDDQMWRHSITDAHNFYQKKEPRIAELTFADKKNQKHVALQAADMVVYRFRQLSEKLKNNELGTPSKLDSLLLKQFSVNSTERFLQMQRYVDGL